MSYFCLLDFDAIKVYNIKSLVLHTPYTLSVLTESPQSLVGFLSVRIIRLERRQSMRIFTLAGFMVIALVFGGLTIAIPTFVGSVIATVTGLVMVICLIHRHYRLTR